MDTQLDFLELWAHACEQFVDWFVDTQAEVGKKEAMRRYHVKTQNFLNEHDLDTPVEPMEDFARHLTVCALHYVALMISYGVFDEQSDA